MKFLIQLMASLARSWTWTMAWRDSRRSRRRLLLYAASIVLGIAALTAISSADHQMQRAIQEQSKALLGADLVVDSRGTKLTGEQETFLKSLGGEQAREITFGSMVYFVKSGGTRLVQVRALEGGFPFYGSLETAPSNGVAMLRSGEGALIEQNLMDMFGAHVGDMIKVGELTFPIAGVLTKVPGETMGFGTIAPRVYIPLAKLHDSRLLDQGSLARCKVYFKFPPRLDVEEFAAQKRNEFRTLRLRYDTVEERQRDLGRALENMTGFLNLIGFVALLLGGVGVASGIHVHMKHKLATIATLRCLGCSAAQSFAIYFSQATMLGLTGAIVGACTGVWVQYLLPSLLGEFIPFSLDPAISWQGLLSGIAIGFAVCMLFALLPLLPIRRVSPLAAIRAAFRQESVAMRDPFVWMLYAVIFSGLIAFSIFQSRYWFQGLAYALAIVAVFGIQTGVASIIVRLARKLVPKSWPFVWRQGLSNLYRPNNRTVLLMVSLGMGTFLVLTLYLVQMNLLGEILRPKSDRDGNAVLFDIQSDQRKGVADILKSQQLPVIEDVPMISMRLRSINGRTVEEIRKDPRSNVRGWALGHEYRSTYRTQLAPTEKLLSGTWHSTVVNTNEPVPVSIEEGVARNLRVGLGDQIVFDVQGVPVTTRVASIREVDWRRLAPNFFVVFPAGVLEDAPATHMIVTRLNSSEQSARLQSEIVRQYPNVSAADLTLILQTVDSVLSKVSFVVRFMALFTVGTGLLVLGGTIVSGRYQRFQECILFRTLGATRRQVFEILAAEYLLLGILAAATGIVFALAANWALATFVFEVKTRLYPEPMLVALGAVSLLTFVFGVVGNRSTLNQPPLEVLRSEA